VYGFDEAESPPTSESRTGSPLDVASDFHVDRTQDDRTERDAGRPATPRPSPRSLARVLALSIGLPLGLYLILRPENYGLTPNTLDPMFYTGYSINFDDILNAVADRHYFVSRWSVYLPMSVADRLFGPIAGRLLWRLALASLILLALWALGRRWSWNTAQRLLIGTVVLSTPFFVRAFFTDYAEYIIVALGVCLICLCLRTQHRWWSATAIGLLAGLILVANPVAASFVVFPLAAAVAIGARGIRGRVWLITLMLAGGATVILGGLVLFRWRYGLDNVYQPSIDFARWYQAPNPDPWRSPSLNWLGSFTWLYTAPALVLTAIGLSVTRVVRFDRVEITALGLCAIQFVYQWFDQFLRGGYGMEVPFYWAYSVPSILVALAVLIGRLSAGVHRKWLAAIGVGWVALLLIGVPDGVRFPAGFGFALLALVAIAAAVGLAPRSKTASLSILLVLVAWMQIGAPTWDEAYLGLNKSPKYDELYRQAGNQSETVFDEAIWFERQMDRISNDATASFVSAGGWSASIVGLYAPHVTGRWIQPDADGRIPAGTTTELRAGTRPIVALLGPPADVDRALRHLTDDVDIDTVLLDETHDSALKYRLVVLALPEPTSLPFTWTADTLPTSVGELDGTEVVSARTDPAGNVTYGPYIELPPGRYRAEFRYRSSLPPTSQAGTADIATAGPTTVATVSLPGTLGSAGSAFVDFTVGADQIDQPWEFRTFRTEAGQFIVESVTLSNR
jgi:hypothetical protein